MHLKIHYYIRQKICELRPKMRINKPEIQCPKYYLKLKVLINVAKIT